ncbi:MAG: lytic murein transglycosylase [Gammaproteobacteria bacterium]
MKLTICSIAASAMLLAGLAGAQESEPGSDARFQEWLGALRTEALDAGISEATVTAALTDVQLIERVVELDRNQPEVKLDFWTYLDRVASQARIDRGRQLMEEHRELLSDVSSRYGIPAETLVAAWGIESSFGRIQGGFPVIQALVTLAYDDRRAAMFRRELFNALRIIDDGHISVEDMQGSWAGAMGQVQFMPSTFLNYARDGDGDDLIDIWQSTPDALESAAAYMASGWRPGYIWGRQVQLPENFDTDLTGTGTRKPLAEWQALGVRRISGEDLPEVDIEGSVVLPDDSPHPAFLVYDNYDMLLRWNRSHRFAISLAHLADRIAGRPALIR